MEREGGCLDDESIVRFLAGRLDTSTRTSIEHHVDDCSACALLILPSGSRPVAGLRSTHALVPGERVAERYRIERLIGGGGMGEVYSALDEQLGERVALKTVRATIADDARAIARLKSEVQLARRVTHPNVCRIFDLGTHSPSDGGQLAFLTMEILHGRTLADQVRRRGAFSNETARKVMTDLVAGLLAAHRAGVIHKDFKSDNVILVAEPDSAGDPEEFTRAVITDFGLAASEHLASPNTDRRFEFSGTPGYIAPERLRGVAATAASDVYSLGVVLLDMLDGHVPASPLSPRSDQAGAALRNVAMRCCQADPDQRPPTQAVATLLANLGQRRFRPSPRATTFFGVGALLMVIVALSLQSRPATPMSQSFAATQAVRPAAAPTAPVTAVAPDVATRPINPAPRQPRRASARPRIEPTPPQPLTVASTPSATQRVATEHRLESESQEDEPIRSLHVDTPKAPSATLVPVDNAPIDPFRNNR